MGDGIRIKHKSVIGPAILAIRDLTEPFTPPHSKCSICTSDPEKPVAHQFKTRHIDIDNEGYAIVSEGVLEGLKHLIDLGGFDIENVVTTPPTQKIIIAYDGTAIKEVVQKYPQQIRSK